MYKLEESTETTVVFDNYTDELEYSLKARKIRWGWIDCFFTKTYCLKWVKRCPKVKIIKSSCQTPKTNLSYWKSSLNILHTRRDLMGRTTLNIEKDTALISHSQKQSLFSLNQVETDTRIALQASFGKSKRYRYISFNGVCFCFNFSVIWLISTDRQSQDC